jgi:broad specificity phosphatase PhoE
MIVGKPFASARLVLIRHPEVSQEHKGVCYGSTDVSLASNWQSCLGPSLAYLQRIGSERKFTNIWHSDLQRTREPAQWLANQIEAKIEGDPRLRERNFGTWQGIPWSDIPSDEMERAHDMLEHPDSFRPGGGETTNEICMRTVAWFKGVISTSVRTAAPTIAAVAHSGSITSLCGTIMGLRPIDWTPYYPKPSQWISIEWSSEGIPKAQMH